MKKIKEICEKNLKINKFKIMYMKEHEISCNKFM